MKEERAGAMIILPRALHSLQWNSNTKRYENRGMGRRGEVIKNLAHFSNATGHGVDHDHAPNVKVQPKLSKRERG